MISSQELINKIKSYHSNLNENLIQKAYIFSKNSHGNQKRHSGELYFSHPLAVAEILVDLKLDQYSIITALLHDVVEDTDITLEEVEELFGSEVAKLVDGVTKLGKIEAIPVKERVAENFRKLTLAMSQDIRVLLVKLADRLHNMRTLEYVPSKEKRVKKAKESLDIYAALAGRIGLSKIKTELEELSFAIIDPENRNQIIERLNEIREQKKDLIERITQDLHELLTINKIEFEISGREKKPYSIWMKMRKQNVGFHNLHDIMAFRVIVNDVAQCYVVLGLINSSYNMIPKTFVDYISTPKENGYRSLHLAILGPFNKKIEIQIRDKKMHEIAQLGLAAHWRYKDVHLSNSKNKEYDDVWIKELIALFESSESASEALSHYKIEAHQDQVFCFTPNGDIFNLPFGATALDFAYAIHSEVGNACVSAKINGAIAPLRQKLENGDQVEISTLKNAKPSSNWLQFVTTNKAKIAIKHFIRSEKHSEYEALGKAVLKKFFVQKELEFSDKILEKIPAHFGKKNLSDIYVKVAEGIITRQEILKIAYPNFHEESTEIKVGKRDKKAILNNAMPIEGLFPGMAMRYGSCCNPILGDSIVGVINSGVGITIHNQNCHQLKNIALNSHKILDVCFKNSNQVGEIFFVAKVAVTVKNQSGALAEVTSAIAKKQVNINNLKIINRSTDYFELLIDLQIKNVDHLEEVFSALRLSRFVIELERVFS